MVIQLSKDPSSRLLKHLIRCYHRLSENARALQALTQCLPDQLKDETFKALLDQDRPTKHWWKMLMKNLSEFKLFSKKLSDKFTNCRYPSRGKIRGFKNLF